MYRVALRPNTAGNTRKSSQSKTKSISSW